MLTTGPNLGVLDNGEYGEQNYAELLRLFRAIDTLVQAHVKSATLATPPTTPSEGDTYIVPAGATGAWAGKDTQLARWTARSAAVTPQWEFFVPKRNWLVGVDDSGANGELLRFTGTAWSRTTTPALPISLMSGVTPAAPNATDGAAYEMGVKLRFAQSGVINAIRYFKAASETGTHIGRIWSSTGTLLASVTFTGETASGWQEQALATPLVVQANTTYVVSVNVNSHYAMTVSGLLSSLINGDISSVADGANGIFNTTAGLFPATAFNNSNYFRDVVFTGDTATVTSITGYGAGQGGAVAQATSKSTAVTLNKPSGEVTMMADLLAAGAAVAFTLNNSQIGINDVVAVTVKRGGTAGAYLVSAEMAGAGTVSIVLRNMSGVGLSEAVVIGFAVIKGSIS